MINPKKLVLEEITSRDYTALRASWYLDQKSPLLDTSSRFSLRFVRIVSPLIYNTFGDVCRDALETPSLVRRVSVRGERDSETGRYNWLRAYPASPESSRGPKIELYAAAAQDAGFMCVNLKTSVCRDHEIGFEVVAGKVASVDIKVPGADIARYCCQGARLFGWSDRVVGLLPRNWVPTGASSAQRTYPLSRPGLGQSQGS